MGLKGFLNTLMEKFSDYTGSFKVENKFSDVQNYVKSKEFLFHSLAGRALRDVDNGTLWLYEYDCSGGKQDDKACRYIVKVDHFGEIVKNMIIELHSNNPKEDMEKAVKKMSESLPVFKAETTMQTATTVIDYSAKSVSEILNELDKTLKDLATNPNMTTLTEIKKMRSALDDKFDLAEKGKFSSSFGTLDMYISTLNTQLSNPMVAVTVGQFVDTYVSQMRAAVSDIASKI